LAAASTGATGPLPGGRDGAGPLRRPGVAVAAADWDCNSRAHWTSPSLRLQMLRAVKAKLAACPELRTALTATAGRQLVWRETARHCPFAVKANEQLMKILMGIRDGKL